MIVIMKPEASDANIQHVIGLVHDFGLKDHVIKGTDRTVVACIGDKRDIDLGSIENAPMVDRIVPILAPYKMASLEVQQEKTAIAIGPQGFKIGGNKVAVIAGPCAVENRDQLLRTADLVKEAGCIGLRAGAFKPRTSPYAFQGMGEEGLKILAEARDNTGLAIVTEVISVETIDVVAHYADVLQIGARNMQHYPLLDAVGKAGKPVLLKRGLCGRLDEFLLAAEYIINGGNKDVILCERGIRTYEDYVRNTFCVAAIPELNNKTHLPVVADPSHGTGHSHLVPAASLAAIAAGADALLLECHIDPEHAMSDGAQSITPDALKNLMTRAKRVAQAIDRDI